MTSVPQTVEERAIANAGPDQPPNREVSFFVPQQHNDVAATAPTRPIVAHLDTNVPRVGVDFSTIAVAPATHDRTTFSALNTSAAVGADGLYGTAGSEGSGNEQNRWLQLVEMLIRVIFFPVIAWKESIESLRAPPLGSQAAFLCAITSSVCWVALAIFMAATPRPSDDTDRTNTQHIVHIVLSCVVAVCTIGVYVAVIHRRVWNPRSYTIANPDRLNFWPFLILVWLRVVFEGVQLAVFPLIYVPLSRARAGNRHSPVGTMADAGGMRYKVVNGILLRAFPSNDTWWSTAANNTGFTPRDAGDEATFDLFWPLCILALWMVSLSFNGMLTRRRPYVRCPTMASRTLAGKERVRDESRWLLSDGFYRALLLLQHQIFDVSGPFGIMLIVAAAQQLTFGYNRDPDVDGMAAPAYQGLGVWFGLVTISTMYLQPRAVSVDVVNADVVESTLFANIRAVVKALFVGCSVVIALAGSHADEGDVEVRATLIAVIAMIVHIFLGALTVALRPYPRDGINATLGATHVLGVFMAMIALISTHAKSDRVAAEGPGAVLIVAGIVGAALIGAFVLYHCKLRHVLPNDDATVDGQDRSRIVSGLRLFSATQGDDFAICDRATVTTILWRPLEPLQIAAADSECPNCKFVLDLLRSSFIPANLGVPAAWVTSLMMAIQTLAPILPHDLLLRALQLTSQYVAHYAAGVASPVTNSAAFAEAALARCTILEHLDETSWGIALKRRAISIGDGEIAFIAWCPKVLIGTSEHQLERLEAFCAVATGLRIEAEALHFLVTSPRATQVLPRMTIAASLTHFYSALNTCAASFLEVSDTIYVAATAHHKKCLIAVREAWLDTFYCLYGCDGGEGVGKEHFSTRALLREYKRWKRGTA